MAAQSPSKSNGGIGTTGHVDKNNLKSKTNDVSFVTKAWESGHTFVGSQEKQKKNWLKNEPWWMRPEESRNPRLLPKYKPWWAITYSRADPSMTVSELKAEAARRGEENIGNKHTLLARLDFLEKMYALSDDNFVAPLFKKQVDSPNNCYPEVYEANLQLSVDAQEENS